MTQIYFEARIGSNGYKGDGFKTYFEVKASERPTNNTNVVKDAAGQVWVGNSVASTLGWVSSGYGPNTPVAKLGRKTFYLLNDKMIEDAEKKTEYQRLHPNRREEKVHQRNKQVIEWLLKLYLGLEQ
jgi:hypothetical protein